jgi:hypothetical protein
MKPVAPEYEPLDYTVPVLENIYDRGTIVGTMRGININTLKAYPGIKAELFASSKVKLKLFITEGVCYSLPN